MTMSGSRTLQAAIFIAALSSCIAAPAFAEPAPAPLHLQVTVCDRASVDQTILSAAKVVTADAYRRIGVIIDWSDAGCIAGAPGVYVNLTSGGAERINFKDVTLGFAESGTSDATVLYDRVEIVARHYHVKRQILLGYTIAHELGHLLLPPHSHSDTGVMRACLNLELAAARLLQFTREQGVLIVRRIESARAPMVVATR
jgi:hypothetical protein